MTFPEIEQEIREKKNLDKHIQSDSHFIRRLVAEQGYKLDQLINDPAEEVRAAVAMQGYGLNTLRNDRSEWVRYHALKMLEQHRNQNAGYQILNRIELGDNHFVVGHNPKAPEPYATWQYFANKDYYYNGHYFTDKETAVIDMFKRAGETLELKDHSLALSLLTYKDQVQLRDQGIREDILFGLENVLDGLDLPADQDYDIDALIQDPAFMEKATHYYQNIDHTYENEALADGLRNLLEEFPQHRKMPALSDPPPIKLSPEDVQFFNALLQHPTAELPGIYGPFGDNITFEFEPGHGIEISLEIRPTCEPGNIHRLSATEPPHINITVTDGNGFKLYEDDIPANKLNVDEKGNPDLTGFWNVPIGHSGQTVKLTIEKDINLQRLDNTFVYRSNTEEDQYKKHDGELCKITRGLTPQECDLLCTGLMWVAEFPNGDLLHVFDYELEQPERGERKPSLAEKISNAAGRQAQGEPSPAPGHENTR